MSMDHIRIDYFEWLYDLVCKDRFPDEISYKKLLNYLHNREFTYILHRDGNRYEDGIDLRRRFISKASYLDGPCSVLEMMVALSIRCEETIMDNPSIGDRTQQWFWGMITNLGLGSMSDIIFDEHYVDDVVTRFLLREYEPNGKGGLFTVRDANCDMRNVEIWYQLCWYLDTIV